MTAPIHVLVLVGGGGAGLRAAIAIAETDPRLSIAVVSKVYPMRSHTVSAEGGAAAVARADDSLEMHGYGTVKGYEEGGAKVPALTTFAGLYQRSAEQSNRPPFDLPPRWVKRKSALNLDTPLNFVGTHDIIGGNSGSPVVNRAGELK